MRYSIGGSKWVKIERDFRSSLLLVRWVRSYTTRVYPNNLAGTIELTVKSPLGKKEPDYRSIACTRNQQNYEYLPIALAPDEYFTIRVKNPDSLQRSAIDITELYPNNLPSNISMPWPASSNNPTDPALLAAMSAQTAVLSAIQSNTSPGAIADAIANNAMEDSNGTIAVGTVPVQILPPDQTRQTASFTNSGGGQIKIWKSNIAPGTGITFANATALALLNTGSPAGEANDVDAKSGWWAICSLANGSLSYAISKTAM